MGVGETIERVGWESIRVSPFQPRRHFSEEELEELAASIREVGLIHPPVVRRVERGGDLLYYELIAGERRWRAARKAGLTELTVLVRAADDEKAAKSTLIENVQRVNLNPIEMAEAFKTLLVVFQMTQEEIAQKVGKKRSTVANYVRLLALPSAIQQAIAREEISMGHAKALLALGSVELQHKLTQLIIEKQLTVREAEKECRTILTKETSLELLSREEERAEQLAHLWATRVEWVEGERGSGVIKIYYADREEGERVYGLLRRLGERCTQK